LPSSSGTRTICRISRGRPMAPLSRLLQLKTCASCGTWGPPERRRAPLRRTSSACP
jgi:hypothetical protein